MKIKSQKVLLTLIQEIKDLSAEIASLKRKANMLEPETDRDQLRQDIKVKQYQALFYIEKMGNVFNNLPY